MKDLTSNGRELPRLHTRMIGLLIVLILGLAACADTAGDPADIVEQYMLAKVESNETGIQQLLCAELEAQLPREVASFETVEASIENMACTSTEGSDIVSCTGEIKVSYGDELRDFPLTAYRVVQEDGEWKWCGEAEAG